MVTRPSPPAGAPSPPPSSGEERGAEAAGAPSPAPPPPQTVDPDEERRTTAGASSSSAPPSPTESLLGDCAYCGARARLKFCTRCQVTRYCGRDCQKADVRAVQGGGGRKGRLEGWRIIT